MRRVSTVASVVMLALAIAGCGSKSEVNIVPTPSAPEVVKKQPAGTLAKPLVGGWQQAAATYSVPGLIQSTNPQGRAKQVAKGRVDPFAPLPGQEVATVDTAPTTKSIISRLPSTPTPPRSPSQIAPKPRNINIGKLLPPPSIPSPALAPSFLPPPPQTDVAQAVAVTGVVKVGNEAQAIVKVPNEVTSRYVREGQLISNGQVRVKRIEMNEGSDPLVVLEQNGIEVKRPIGEAGVNPSKTGKPTTAIPGSPSLPGAPSSRE